MADNTAPVPAYPTIDVQLNADGSAHVDVAGRAVDYPPADVDTTRVAVLAQAVEVARLLGRAVRMNAEEPTGTYDIAVHPDGTLTELSATTTPRPKRTVPVTPPAVTTPEPQPEPVAAWIDVPQLEHARAVPSRLTLHFTFSTQEPVDVGQNAAIGRNPSAVDGRLLIPVQSPQRMLSRTHALVDVDEHGRILVTDHHSGNGIETQTEPPQRFTPGVPYIVESGTSLLMGDVICTIEVRP